jgi:dihydroorotate dehydrogenase (NAD+) catalytic subunit
VKPEMSVRFAGLLLRNPVIAASGTFGYGVEFEDVVSLDRIGGFITKGLSLEPMAGNQAPRLIETPGGMINAIGLQNIGVKAFIEKKLPALRPHSGTACIANVFGYEIRDYVGVIELLNSAPGIAAYELNASCPNTQHGGMVFGTDTGILDQMARCAENAGADALSLVNTFLSLSIDVESRRPRIANNTGGLSGPAIKPIAVRMVYEAAQAVKIPICGLGGITTAEDAVEFLLAGATAVQIGTASYADPRAVQRIAESLERWCVRHRVAKVKDLIGAVQPN